MPSTPPKTILIVDDEPMSSKWLVRLLEDEFSFLSADGAEAALAILRDRGSEIAVVMTDYRMPLTNGLDLMQAVQVQNPHVTLILLTAFADKSVSVEAINKGRAYRILEKPIDEAQMRVALRDALSHHHQRALERNALADRAQSVRETLGFMAHEMGTPLSSTVMCLHALRERLEEAQGLTLPEASRLLDLAERQTLYAQSIVKAFVSSAQVAFPGSAAPAQSLSAGHLVEQLIDVYAFTGDEASWVVQDVHLDFKLPPRRDLLFLVLSTLLRNALQALHESAAAAPSVRIEVDGKTRQIRVRDNGPGIPAAILEQLTSKPVTTRAAKGGNGMGLLFCRRIMESCAGEISIASTPGQGVCVIATFSAPAASPHAS